MKQLVIVSLAALLAGCPEEEKKETPPTPSASVSIAPKETAAPTASAAPIASATAIADAAVDAAPADAGKVADAGKPAAAAPKK